MNLNPWKDDSKFNDFEAAIIRWLAIAGAIGGGLLGLGHSSLPGLIAGVIAGTFGAALVGLFGFNFLVAPVLFFIYGFVELFELIRKFFTPRR